MIFIWTRWLTGWRLSGSFIASFVACGVQSISVSVALTPAPAAPTDLNRFQTSRLNFWNTTIPNGMVLSSAPFQILIYIFRDLIPFKNYYYLFHTYSQLLISQSWIAWSRVSKYPFWPIHQQVDGFTNIVDFQLILFQFPTLENYYFN